VPKFIHFHPVINSLQRSAFWDLVDFWPIFRVSERPKVCAFISQKLNKLGRPFFIFPNNLCCSIRIWKISHLRVKVRGLQRPQNASRAQNFKIFTFSRALCAQMVRPSAPVPILFCTGRGPLMIPPTEVRRRVKFWPQPLLGGPPPKKFFFPISGNSWGWGPNFRVCYMRTTKTHQG